MKTEIYKGVEIYQMENGDFSGRGYWNRGTLNAVKTRIRILIDSGNWQAENGIIKPKSRFISAQ